ncbi:sensor histidine kinase [Spirosoma luteum]|uniref:sensor histidine kinase n=1 Tax=Spirosoma luteum TaxID=431553 RepID=UPI00037E28A4|nr:ATP-binding protein [Spirosoma luteum]
MTLKTKIALSLGFLFSIILLLGGLSAFYLNRLARDSRAILKDNSVSLQLVSDMQKALTELDRPDALTDFEASLQQQEANVTEVGEQQATSDIRREFNRLKGQALDARILGRMQLSLFSLNELNRQAIVRKSHTADQTARDAMVWLGFMGTLGFLVVFSFVISIPGYIANPLRELTQGIKQIASRNFEERLTVRSRDEWGELAQSFNAMAQKLHEFEHSSLARVLFEKKRVDTLVEIMPDGLIGLDEQRRILFINPVAGRLLGVDRQGAVGQYAPDLAATNDLMRLLISDIMTEGLPRPPTGNNLLKITDPASGNGPDSYFVKQIHAVEVAPPGETNAMPAGYLIVLQNVTSYQQRDLAKTNFIATVSHELKTPISSIKLSLKLLQDQRVGLLNAEQKQLVNHVGDSADRLLTITGELLNMAQVESGQIQLHMQAVNPDELVRAATSALTMQAEQKDIHFAVSLSPNLPAVKADPDKASWVLINFLSNALRHSPDQSRVEITTQQIGDQIEFRVRDYGPGIREEFHERVFERYGKAPSLPGSFSGTGLGLSISKEFIQSMGGRIGLYPDGGSGATFFFQLAVA